MRFNGLVSFLLMALVLSVTSCSNLGSIALPPDRMGYNKSLLNSDEQQNLLNIVRLRYTDPPYFLSVNNVVSQLNFGSDFSVNVANSTPPPSLLGSGNASFNYSEAPTITYTPLQGEDYVNRLFTPIDLSVLYMLFRSGWSVHHVSRVMVQRFGDIANADLASRATSGRLPVYKEFVKTIAVFRHLQNDENVVISPDKVNGKFAIKFTIKNFKLLTAKERLIFSRYGVTASSPNIWFVSAPTKQKNEVTIETRTVIGMLNYLSKGVDVPGYDVANQQVRMTHYPDGKLFNWHSVTKGIAQIRSSRAKPENAFVAVPYRGSWFYVPQNDFMTKETLNLLSIIMGIYQGNIKSVLPVFTVS